MPIPEVPKRSRRALKLALVLLALFATLLVAEAAVRVRARVRGEPYSAAATEREMKRLVGLMTASRLQGMSADEDARAARLERAASARERKPEGWKTPEEQGAIALHPYLGFDWAENGARIGRDVEYFASAESRRNYDVLVVGGSVAGGFGLNGADELVGLLEADPLFQDRPVRIHGEGRGGYKQPQQLLLVTYLFGAGYRPDLVLNIDGFNECALASANVEHAVHPAHPSVSHWAHLASTRRTDRTALDHMMDMRAKQRQASDLAAQVRSWHLQHSALAGALACLRLRGLQRQYVELGQRYVDYLAGTQDVTVSGPPFARADAAALGLDTWFESSRSLDALCRARSIRYLHVLQPTLHDPGSKPLTEAEIANGTCPDSWRVGVAAGYPSLRALGARLRELGVHFVDGSDLFRDVTEKLYFDACHFDQRGTALLARRIAAAILADERAAR